MGKPWELKPVWHSGKTKASVGAGSATVPLLLTTTAFIHNKTMNVLFSLTSIRPTEFPKDLDISLSFDSYRRTFPPNPLPAPPPPPQQVLSSDEVFSGCFLFLPS